ITTVSGSQIKLFIQINDLETSEFVSEMLGETTQVYKTPVMRPGQGIFAPRVWTPHYTPRPLRSPLELREMSARVAILMVKNSRSFELTKIRHYQDKPYRRLYEAAKGKPDLPTLRKWRDEVLGGVINPATAMEDVPEENRIAQPSRDGRKAARKSPVRKAPAKSRSTPEPTLLPTPLVIAKAPTGGKAPRKSLSFGDMPKAPRGETCDIREVLAASETVQRDDFEAMISPATGTGTNDKIHDAIATLSRLQDGFGDDEPTG
ncbi:MAG: TraM recognition domain-containing protein, partial [Candidatus Afipia apatlaquensis]|nr:TraM recognition domain-containing protein [Candidatus Afipia apatlaquensis]